MAQRAQFIDLTRTYLPIDPAAMPETLSNSDAENAPEKRIPVMAYEGHNFMPTGQGYRSYFGLNASVDLEALPPTSLVDAIFVYQKQDYTNLIIALCSDGIYTNEGNASGQPWNKITDIPEPSTEANYKPWSYCVIGNTLYMYYQGAPNLWRIQIDSYQEILPDGTDGIFYGEYEITPLVPSFLNMAGQIGIFKAGGRLGFWDSDNAVSWSAFEDQLDFVPAIKTQANVTKFVDVVGRITRILQHGDGFIIYSTKSIVYVSKDLTNTLLWKTAVLSTNVGVAYARQIAMANPDTLHFAWTANGLVQVNEGKAEQIGTELYDYLKESSSPIFLSILQGRFLFLELMDGSFIGSPVDVYTSFFPATTLTLANATEARTILVSGAVNIPPITISQLFNALRAPTRDDALSRIASIDYGVAGKTWPTYSVGYIDTYQPPQIVGGYPPFTMLPPGTLTATIAGNASIIADPTLYQLHGGYNYLPDIPALTDAAYTSKINLMTNLMDSTLAGATPDSTTSNVVQGTPITVTNGEDTFGKALIAWQKERDWMKAFTDVLQTNINAYVPITDETVGLQSTTLRDAIIAGNGAPSDVVVATYYIPWEVVPEHYELKNHVLYMIQGIKSYKKIEVIKRTTQNAVTITAYQISTPEGSWDSAVPGAEEYIKHRPNGFFRPDAVFTSSGISAQANYFGIMYYNGTYYQYYGYVDSTNQGNLTATDWPKTGTSSVTTSYYTRETIISTDPDRMFYRAYVPEDGVALEDIRWYGSSWSVIWPTIGAGGYTIQQIQNEATGVYAGGGTYDATTGVWSYGDGTVNGFTLDGVTYTYAANPAVVIEFPAGAFLLQSGSASPAYPALTEAFVYDLNYKRWGKMKNNYQHLLDFTPINTLSSSLIPYSSFGVEGALLTAEGVLYSFDANPSSSYIKYGKIGMSRLGFTSLEEIHAQFRLDSTGTIEVESSLDGKYVDASLTKTASFSSTKLASLFDGPVGKWHNISLTGQYDLTYLEYRSFTQGRR